MQDTLAEGRTVRILTVLDVHTRECVAAVPARSFRGGDVVRVLRQVAATRALPKRIRVDNGTEFTSEGAGSLGVLERGRVGLQPAREARRQHLHRSLQRHAAARVLIVTLVPRPRGPRTHTGEMARRLQPPPSAQQFGGRPAGRISDRLVLCLGPQPARLFTGLVDSTRGGAPVRSSCIEDGRGQGIDRQGGVRRYSPQREDGDDHREDQP
jgi:integrase-like protein